MDLYILFAQPAGMGEPPTALLVWSGYDREDNEQGFQSEVEQTITKYSLRDPNQWASFKIMKVGVSLTALHKHLNETPSLTGFIQE